MKRKAGDLMETLAAKMFEASGARVEAEQSPAVSAEWAEELRLLGADDLDEPLRTSEARGSPGSSHESEQRSPSGPQTFGQFLTQELEQRGLSDGDVASKSGGRLTRQHVGRLKRDEFKNKPRAGTLRILAEATEIDHEELRRWASKKAP
jgi:hypothetical protein